MDAAAVPGETAAAPSDVSILALVCSAATAESVFLPPASGAGSVVAVQVTAAWHPAVHGKRADAAGERLESSAKRTSRSADGAADVAAALRHADSQLVVDQPLAHAEEPSQTTPGPFCLGPAGKGYPPARISKLPVRLPGLATTGPSGTEGVDCLPPSHYAVPLSNRQATRRGKSR